MMVCMNSADISPDAISCSASIEMCSNQWELYGISKASNFRNILPESVNKRNA